MIELPPALAPWAPHLAIFPDEIALCLGHAAARAAGALGPWPLRDQHAGDPDGYDGLARRGSYERLLPSEWLLLEELPEEFLRRVVSHEHAFLARGFRQLGGGRHCAVLLDAGPEQLGAPRLAHLALLIALAQRAANAGATLEWATLSPGPLVWHHDVSEAAVLALLQQRHLAPLAQAELARNLEEAAARTAAVHAEHELWLIGGPTFLGACDPRARCNCITVSDELELDTPPRVRLELRRPDSQRTVLLDLPSDRLATQLLRDPFARAEAPPMSVGGVTDALITSDGRRLFLRDASGGLTIVAVPNSQRAARSADARFFPPPAQRLIAVGKSRSQRTVALCLGEGELIAHVLSKRAAVAMQTRRFSLGAARACFERPALRPLAVYGEERFVVCDDAGVLFELHAQQMTPFESGVIAFQPGANNMLWLTHVGDELTWKQHAGSLRTDHVPAATLQRLLARGPSTRTLLARGPGPVAASAQGHTFTLYAEQRETLSVPEHLTLHGLIGPPWELLALDPTRHQIVALNSQGARTLCTSTIPLAALAVSPQGSFFAYVTTRSQLSVFSVADRHFVVRGFGSEVG